MRASSIALQKLRGNRMVRQSQRKVAHLSTKVFLLPIFFIENEFSTFWGGNRWETKGYPMHFEVYKTKYHKLLDMSRRRPPRSYNKFKAYSFATYCALAFGTMTYMGHHVSRRSWTWYGTNAEYAGYWGRLPSEYGCDEVEVINTFMRGPGPRIATYYPDYPEWAAEEDQRDRWRYAIYPKYGSQRPSHVPFWYELPEGTEPQPI